MYTFPSEAVGLRSLGLRNSYTTARHNLARDFFSPALATAIRYDRGVGYFSSGWISANAGGLAALAMNGGKARWITSPMLSKTDIDALESVQRLDQDQKVLSALMASVEDLRLALERDTLNTMAWLVADGLLEFRFAIASGVLDGDFHDKFGVFYDESGQRVSFLGSYNDTAKGLRNYESIRVFFSWDPAGIEIVDEDEQRFTRIWTGQEPNLRVFDLPQAIKKHILQLRNSERPYPTPFGKDDEEHGIHLTEVFPRDYQLDAIAQWEANGRHGILDMATGTGKTLTALTAITRCSDAGYIIVAAPTRDLVDQWIREIGHLSGLRLPIIEVSSNNAKWREQALSRFRLLAAAPPQRPFFFVGTYQSLVSEDFLRLLSDLEPRSASGLLVADEVHHLGAPVTQYIMKDQFSFRLGLTATLERSFDDDGTQAVLDYFGGVVFRLTLEEAVGTILCHYKYDVAFAELNEEEFDEYQKLSARIAQLSDHSSRSRGELPQSGYGSNVERLLIRRSQILKQAESKLAVLQSIINHIPLRRCLIYCADLDQVAVVQHLLARLGIPHLPYTSEQSIEQRRATLAQLARNEIHAVVAVNCLDEGVDVPQVNQAILLASSTSKRQFVQRRGRILRKAPGKQAAHLIDLFTVPPRRHHEQPPSLLYNELLRSRLLAAAADNRYEVELTLHDELAQFGIPIEAILGDGDDFD